MKETPLEITSPRVQALKNATEKPDSAATTIFSDEEKINNMKEDDTVQDPEKLLSELIEMVNRQETQRVANVNINPYAEPIPTKRIANTRPAEVESAQDNVEVNTRPSGLVDDEQDFNVADLIRPSGLVDV